MVHAQTGRHWATRRVRWFGLAAFVLTGGAPRPAAAQLSVDQAEIFLEPRAAGQGITSFNVANEGDSVVEATIYLADWDRKEDGEHRFLASGSLGRSCGRLLRVFPLSVRLTPHAKQAVRVALEQADTLKAACWSIVFIESAATPGRRGRQIAYVTRLGVKIYALPSGLTKDGEVAGLVVQARRIGITFANTGGMPLWVRGSVEYRRADNSVAATDSIAEFPILPDARRTIVLPVAKLAPGKYVALALLDYGGSEIAAGQIVVDVP